MIVVIHEDGTYLCSLFRVRFGKMSVFMLNCGGTVDLNENLSLPSSSKCLVVDSHRPIHLGNIRSDSRVDFYELNKE